MASSENPPGWSFNPSAWSHRLPILALAVVGFGVATYLALFQLGVVAHVWEPFFGNGSIRILKESAIARMLPIPDAALGAFAYLLDGIADAAGGTDRWRTAPWLVFLFGLIALSLGLTGLLLALLQPFAFGAFCTLCLVSAACSVLTAAAASPEVLAAYGRVRQQREAGKTWRQALAGD